MKVWSVPFKPPVRVSSVLSTVCVLNDWIGPGMSILTSHQEARKTFSLWSISEKASCFGTPLSSLQWVLMECHIPVAGFHFLGAMNPQDYSEWWKKMSVACWILNQLHYRLSLAHWDSVASLNKCPQSVWNLKSRFKVRDWWGCRCWKSIFLSSPLPPVRWLEDTRVNIPINEELIRVSAVVSNHSPADRP